MNLRRRLRDAFRVNAQELSRLFFDLSKGILLGLLGAVVFTDQPLTLLLQIVSVFSASTFIVIGMTIRYIYHSQENDND